MALADAQHDDFWIEREDRIEVCHLELIHGLRPPIRDELRCADEAAPP